MTFLVCLAAVLAVIAVAAFLVSFADAWHRVTACLPDWRQPATPEPEQVRGMTLEARQLLFAQIPQPRQPLDDHASEAAE